MIQLLKRFLPSPLKKLFRILFKELRKISPKFGIDRTQVLNDLLDGEKLVAIDVGSANGLQPHWSRMFDNMRLLAFEPHKESFAQVSKLWRNKIQEGSFTLVSQGLSDKTGTKKFFRTNVPTGSSLLEPNQNSDYTKNNTYFFPVTEEKITTISLTDAVEQENFPDAHIIKLDVQGFEYNILRSLSAKIWKSLIVIEVEINLIDSYKNSKSLSEYIALHKKNGFELLDMRTNRGSRPLNIQSEYYKSLFKREAEFEPAIAKRLVEVDAIFIKSYELTLKQKDPKVLLRQIALLCVYNFFHEAAFLLAKGVERKIFSETRKDSVLNNIILLKEAMKAELGKVRKDLKRRDGIVWAQYMSTPYPSC